MRSRTARLSIRAIFGAPLLVAVASAAGLTLGLLGDGRWSAFAWMGLGVPAALSLRCMARHRPRRASARRVRTTSARRAARVARRRGVSS